MTSNSKEFAFAPRVDVVCPSLKGNSYATMRWPPRSLICSGPPPNAPCGLEEKMWNFTES
jgi:hypothetical protein